MKGSTKHQIILTTLLFFAFTSNVMALGLGVYTSGGSGDSEWERDRDNATFDRDVDQREIGFVLDTTVSKDKLFNYRLNVGKLWVDYDTFEMDGIIMNHSFGFGLVRKENFRLWAGPQLSVKYLEGDSSSGTTYLAGVGLGPVIGANFNITDLVTLSAEAGVRGIVSYAEYESDYSSDFDQEYDITEHESFLSVSVLFRLSGD